MFGFNCLLIGVKMHMTADHQSTAAYSKHSLSKQKLKLTKIPKVLLHCFTGCLYQLIKHKVQISVTDFEIKMGGQVSLKWIGIVLASAIAPVSNM